MRVAIFCGSSRTATMHDEAAASFTRDLVATGAGIVYGGGRVGLMGVVADTAMAAGGEVIGVMPKHLVDLEVSHGGVTRLEVVASMHERKARMAELADAFIALPGGAGTMEEIFEAWTWGQLGLHRKPSALLDIGGFYAPLVAQLQRMAEMGYVGAPQLEALGVVQDAEEFLSFVERYRHPVRTRLPTASDDSR